MDEFKKSVGLPPDASPEQVKAAMEIASMYRGDPIQYVRQLIQEIGQDPELAARLGEGDESEDIPEPQPDLEATDAQGRVVGRAYSDKRLAEREKWFEANLMRKLQGMLGPYLEWTNSARSAQEVEQVRAESRQTAVSIIDEARVNLPHFKENEKEIQTALAAIPKERKMQIGAVAALYEAYNRVLKEKVLPTLSHTAEQKAIEDQRRRAAAGSDNIAPTATATTVTNQRPRTKDQLAERMRQRATQS